MKYTPTNKDKEFANELVRVMAHNGTWVLPSIDQAFRLNKEAKRLELIGGTDELMDRHTAVFETIGYAVVDARHSMN